MTKIRSEFLNDFIMLDGKFWSKMIFVNNFDIGEKDIGGRSKNIPLTAKNDKNKNRYIYYIYVIDIIIFFTLDFWQKTA